MSSPHSLQMSRAASRAMMQKANERTAVYFASSIAGLSLILATAHFANVLLVSPSSRGRGNLTRNFNNKGRFVRSTLLRKVPLFPSLGHGLLFMVYLAINIILLVQNLDLSLSRNWAKRMGWITACNLSLITFLALKNTPLAFLTAYSYDRLNVLHQAAGYCTVFFALLHAVLYIITDANLESLSDLLELEQIMGIVAGLAMLSIFTTAILLRRVRYEAFYIVHIIMFMLVIISVGMHRPDVGTKSIYIIIFSACIWFSDRLLRGTRILLNSLGNRVTIYPLPQGGVRIVMRRTPWRTIPGTHVFLWIPKIRAIETHPFTVVSTNPLEVVISLQDGFTRDLYGHASIRPGAVLSASCDGPYGTLPNFAKYDHIILVAGGSGATFTISVALNLIRKMPSDTAKPVVHFVWVIRHHDMKNWFEKELAELSISPLVKLTIYVTRTLNPMNLTNEKQASNEAITQAPSFGKSDADMADPEKLASISGSSSPQTLILPMMPGRPDISATIQHIVGATDDHERTIVAACGPESLMSEARGIVGVLMKSSGKSVTLHCEQFGW